MSDVVGGPRYVQLEPGDAAPWFHQRSTGAENFAFDSSAGRYVVLCFHISAGDPLGQRIVQAVEEHRTLFDDTRLCFFGVSLDPADEREGRLREHRPGIRYFWDFDGRIGRLYGAIPRDAVAGSGIQARRFWLVLDPTLRVMARFAVAAEDGAQAAVIAYLKALPPVDRFLGFEVPAPILVLPHVFEPDLCAGLIATYEREGGQESGFMRDVAGRTVYHQDHRHKRRRDCLVGDAATIALIRSRIVRRISPELKKIHAFNAKYIERYLVGCYAAEDGAHFRAHRDNTTKGTAHRRFAVSINLNDDFEGGEVSFPEYGSRRYKAPPGGAVVFPCAVLHAVGKVERGRRYAFLPFLYDEEAEGLRKANLSFVDRQDGLRPGDV